MVYLWKGNAVLEWMSMSLSILIGLQINPISDTHEIERNKIGEKLIYVMDNIFSPYPSLNLIRINPF